MPRLLDLLSETGSVGRAFAELGWEVVSLDLDARPGPPSAPTCAAGSYSRALTRRPRKLEEADRSRATRLPAVFFSTAPATLAGAESLTERILVRHCISSASIFSSSLLEPSITLVPVVPPTSSGKSALRASPAPVW